VKSAWVVLVFVLLAVPLGACGESDEEKAQNTVCDAKADIGQEVDELKSVTPGTFTADGVTQNLSAIQVDLKNMSAAQSELSDDRRSEVEAATKEFTGSVQAVAGELGGSLSASDAKAQVVSSLQELEASYKKAFAPVDCG
jgi:hypothetical protein